MQLTFRWYGPDDPVRLEHVRQIPGMTGIVSALYDVPPGEPWTRAGVERLAEQVETAGLELSVIESIPVAESIKLGRDGRSAAIDAFCRSLEAVAAVGARVVCYNFMPVFDWTRTDLALRLPDSSTALAYDHDALGEIDLSLGTEGLPGWSQAYTVDELAELRAAYAEVDAEALWDHFAYFLERVVPVAEELDVKLAVHPDDPPWPVFGLPRILTSGDALARACALVDSPANGVTLCTGSLGADPEEARALPETAHRLSRRVHFVHARNVTHDGPRRFHEAPHPGGDVDLYAVLEALHAAGFDGPVRPDHGRMIWGEGDQPYARPGYGLYDRALGAAYLLGLWDAIAQRD